MAADDLCMELQGVWRNAVGSTMNIEVEKSDERKAGGPLKFIGTYSSGVQTSMGVVGSLFPLRGLVTPISGENAVLVSWSVVWNGRKSVTTWVGQSMKEGGGATMIFATWVLRTLEPVERWQANRINQDNFWKVKTEKIDLQPSILEEVGSNEGLVGCWNSLENDLFRINLAKKTGKVEGEHLGLLHPDEGGPGARSALVGVTDSGDDFVTVGFSVAGGPLEIKGWAGFIYSPQGTELPVMETAWLSHKYNASFYAPREMVRFGMDNYKKQPQLPASSTTAEEKNATEKMEIQD